MRVASGVFALAALATGGPTNPVGAVFTGLAFISIGVSLGIDLGLDAWNDWGRDTYHDAAKAADAAWDGAFEVGRDVVEGAGDVIDGVGDAIGSGWRKLGGLF